MPDRRPFLIAVRGILAAACLAYLAGCAAGNNVASDKTSDPQPSQLTAPGNLEATAGNAIVTLNWTGDVNATAYSVKRAMTNEGPFTQVGVPSATAYTDSSVTNGTAYYYVVAAMDAASESSNSAVIGATPRSPR